MSDNQQEDVVASVPPDVQDIALQVRERATVALAILAATTVQIHNEQMTDWLLEQPEMSQAFDPMANTFMVTYKIRRVLEHGVTKQRQFHAIFENGELVNTSVDYCVTDAPVEPTVIVA